MKIITMPALMLGLLSTTSFACEYQDDLINHQTILKNQRVSHTAVKVKDIPVGTVVYLDSRLGPDQKLCLNPKGQLLRYTCPIVPNVKGLEKPRDMGLAPQYMMDPSATRIEVTSMINNLGFEFAPGLYLPIGPMTVSSVVQGNQRIDTKQMLCKTGQDDNMLITLLYKEYLHHIPCSINFTGGYLLRNNLANTAPAPCFTLSCWYLPTTVSQDGTLKNIFSWNYPAPEPELKGQLKKIQFGITNAPNKLTSKFSMTLPSVIKENGYKIVKIPASVKIIKPAVTQMITTENYQGTKEVLVTDPAELEQVALAWKAKKPGFRRGPSVYSSGRCKGGWWSSTIYPFYKTVPVTLTRPCKPYVKIITPAVTQNIPATEQKIPEVITKLTYGAQSSIDMSSSDSKWMHLVLQVNATTKKGILYSDGKKVLEFTNPNLISLNSACTLQLGDLSMGMLADVIMANGQLYEPEMFACQSSQHLWTPKKFTGVYGVNGFHMDAKTENFGSDSSPNKSNFFNGNKGPFFRIGKSPTYL